MTGLSLAHGAIEVQNSDHKDNEEPIEHDQENKPKRPPSGDDYNQDIPVDENGLSIPEYEFNQLCAD